MRRDDDHQYGDEGERSNRPRRSGARREGVRRLGDRSREPRDFGDRFRGSRDYLDRPHGPRDLEDRPRRSRDFDDVPRTQRDFAHGDRPRPSRSLSDRPRGPRNYGDRSSRPRHDRPRQYGQRDNRSQEDRDEMIFGIHAIRESLEAGDQIDFIYVKRETNSELMQELLEAIGEHRVPIRRVPVEKLNRLTSRNHQGVIAVKVSTHYFTLEQVVPTLFEAGRQPFIVVLDGITDVRNFGAIARTCECTGVDAIVIFEQNSVSVTADAVKTSAGALSRIAVCRESSIESALDYLKKSGIKLIGASEKADHIMYEVDMKGSSALIMGAEDTGLSEYSLSQCDDLVRIPLYGEIGSLNVSVATGIILYESIRQKR